MNSLHHLHSHQPHKISNFKVVGREFEAIERVHVQYPPGEDKYSGVSPNVAVAWKAAQDGKMEMEPSFLRTTWIKALLPKQSGFGTYTFERFIEQLMDSHFVKHFHAEIQELMDLPLEDMEAEYSGLFAAQQLIRWLCEQRLCSFSRENHI